MSVRSKKKPSRAVTPDVWKVVGTPSTTAPIAKGNRVPPYGGKAVTWSLVSYA